MKIIPNQIDEHLYMLELAETSSHPVLNMLSQKNIEWELTEFDQGFRDNRYIGDFIPTNKELPLLQYYRQFRQPEFKEQIISLMTSNDLFVSMHNHSKEQLLECTELNLSYYMVSADFGFGGRHIDYPINSILALGLIYFDNQESNTRGTMFESWNGNYGIMIPSGNQKGWLVINSEKSFHQICNFGDNRYGLKFWLTLKRQT